tara:strand:+ start:227 stop:328 length:102 start_codon:yes stop_codon:yes gene_type:complete
MSISLVLMLAEFYTQGTLARELFMIVKANHDKV